MSGDPTAPWQRIFDSVSNLCGHTGPVVEPIGCVDCAQITDDVLADLIRHGFVTIPAVADPPLPRRPCEFCNGAGSIPEAPDVDLDGCTIWHPPIEALKAAAVKCCDAGRRAYPEPCPWHGVPVPDPAQTDEGECR